MSNILTSRYISTGITIVNDYVGNRRFVTYTVATDSFRTASTVITEAKRGVESDRPYLKKAKGRK